MTAGLLANSFDIKKSGTATTCHSIYVGCAFAEMCYAFWNGTCKRLHASLLLQSVGKVIVSFETNSSFLAALLQVAVRACWSSSKTTFIITFFCCKSPCIQSSVERSLITNRLDVKFPEETLHAFGRQNTDNEKEGPDKLRSLLWSVGLLICGRVRGCGKSLDQGLTGKNNSRLAFGALLAKYCETVFHVLLWKRKP